MVKKDETETKELTLKELRLLNGLTQKELAQRFGCSIPTYAKIENFLKPFPEGEKYKQIILDLLEILPNEKKGCDAYAEAAVASADNVEADKETGSFSSEWDEYGTDYLPEDEDIDLGNIPCEDNGEGLFPESECTLCPKDVDYDEKRDSRSFEELMEMFGTKPSSIKKPATNQKNKEEQVTGIIKNENAGPVPGDYVVYTDGSCLKNPSGPGGFAARIINQETGRVTEISKGYKSTTNNRMEIMAVLEALKCIPKGSRVHIYTDSTYVSNIMSGKHNYSANKDLWNQILALVKGIKYKMTWVKGHANDENNNRCDVLARTAAQQNDGNLLEDTGFIVK